MAFVGFSIPFDSLPYSNINDSYEFCLLLFLQLFLEPDIGRAGRIVSLVNDLVNFLKAKK